MLLIKNCNEILYSTRKCLNEKACYCYPLYHTIPFYVCAYSKSSKKFNMEKQSKKKIAIENKLISFNISINTASKKMKENLWTAIMSLETLTEARRIEINVDKDPCTQGDIQLGGKSNLIW